MLPQLALVPTGKVALANMFHGTALPVKKYFMLPNANNLGVNRLFGVPF
jgi:hypothetical protein